MKNIFQNKKYVWYTIGAIVLVFGLSLILSYLSSSRDPVSVAFKRLYPAAFVDSRIISINDLEQSKIIAKNLGSITEQQALDLVFDTERAKILTKRLKVIIPSDAASDELRYYTKGSESDYKKLLEDYFNNSDYLFFKYILYPQVYEAALRVKYNSDLNLNKQAHDRATSLINRINAGESFELLAKAESDDKSSVQFGGDIGFYEDGQLIPELQNQISISAMAQIRQDVVISRLGYHIIFPIEQSSQDGKKLWHIKHILIQTSGFEKWFDQQTKDIPVKIIKRV